MSLQRHNCKHTRTHAPHRAGDLALYYYAGDSKSELTFQDLHVEATVRPDVAVRPTLTLILTLTLLLLVILMHARSPQRASPGT